MSAIAAVEQLERRGIDVYVRRNGEVLLRSKSAGQRISRELVAYALLHRAEISAYGVEWNPN